VIAPLIEQEIPIIGGRDVEVLLQDYDQMTLVPLPGERLLKAPAAELTSPTTLPVGFGGATSVVTQKLLERGDRVLFFTDGVIEEDRTSGGESGETRLRNLIEQISANHDPVQETVRLLSRALMLERGGLTSDDATLLLLEWRGGSADYLAPMDDALSTTG
jgi:hypothetical protein